MPFLRIVAGFLLILITRLNLKSKNHQKWGLWWKVHSDYRTDLKYTSSKNVRLNKTILPANNSKNAGWEGFINKIIKYLISLQNSVYEFNIRRFANNVLGLQRERWKLIDSRKNIQFFANSLKCKFLNLIIR